LKLPTKIFKLTQKKKDKKKGRQNIPTQFPCIMKQTQQQFHMKPNCASLMIDSNLPIKALQSWSTMQATQCDRLDKYVTLNHLQQLFLE